MNSTSKRQITRYQASLIHLAVSFLLSVICFGALLWLWYSPGLWTLITIPRALWTLMIGAALAGPVMTLVVYRPYKAGLFADMAIIAVIQVVLLAFTIFALGRIRPVFLVAAVDRFELVRAAELAPEDLAEATEDHRTLSWTGPSVVGVQLPTDSRARYGLIMSGFAGKDVHLLPRLYSDYRASAKAMARRAQPLDMLAQGNSQALQSVQESLANTGRTHANTAYVPIRGPNNRAASMLVDADTGQIVQPIGIDPWPPGHASPN